MSRDCRFLDIDHDREVDPDDYALFATAMAGLQWVRDTFGGVEPPNTNRDRKGAVCLAAPHGDGTVLSIARKPENPSADSVTDPTAIAHFPNGRGSDYARRFGSRPISTIFDGKTPIGVTPS